ncbi:MAG: hypothetical protein AB1714_10750 [Acidobacteriota bacterium]
MRRLKAPGHPQGDCRDTKNAERRSQSELRGFRETYRLRERKKGSEFQGTWVNPDRRSGSHGPGAARRPDFEQR